jgi:hypothetical protein
MSAIQELTVLHPPAPHRFAPRADISTCLTYRDAVQLAYARRTRKHMTQRTLAEETGIYAPHLSQILHPEPVDRHGRKRMDLLAEDIDAFERAVGNHIIRQWIVQLGCMSIAEEVMAGMNAFAARP